ncbi:hypothetical protein Tco_0984331 [Tanacetum coccineum]
MAVPKFVDSEQINRVAALAAEVNSVTMQRERFLEELDSLGTRHVPAKMDEFLREIQRKDEEIVSKLRVLVVEMELNASKKNLFIEKLQVIIFISLGQIWSSSIPPVQWRILLFSELLHGRFLSRVFRERLPWLLFHQLILVTLVVASLIAEGGDGNGICRIGIAAAGVPAKFMIVKCFRNSCLC